MSSTTTAANPLLTLDFHIPFDQIRASHVEPAVAALIREARARVENLSSERAARNFDNTMKVLDELTEPLDCAMAVVRHLESVATYPELRAAYNAVQPEVSAFYSGIPLHAGLWHAVKEYAGTPEAASLAPERARFLHKTVESFRRQKCLPCQLCGLPPSQEILKIPAHAPNLGGWRVRRAPFHCCLDPSYAPHLSRRFSSLLTLLHFSSLTYPSHAWCPLTSHWDAVCRSISSR